MDVMLEQLKNPIGLSIVLASAKKEPVTILNRLNGEPVGVILSPQDYNKLCQAQTDLKNLKVEEADGKIQPSW